MMEHHDYPANVRDTLGEAVAAAALLASTLKFQGLLTLLLLLAYAGLAAVWVRTVEAFARVAAGLAIAATATSVYAIGQYFGVDPWGWSPYAADLRVTTGDHVEDAVGEAGLGREFRDPQQ